jgi:hypothetical protein
MSIRGFIAGCCLCLLLLPTSTGFSRNERTRGAAKNADGKLQAFRTWFVRPDGGDRKECTGKSDAAYSGKGTLQACAFRHPYYLFTSDVVNNKVWIVQGADTVILRGGPYRMGYKGPTQKDSWGSCVDDPQGCSMPPLPSGLMGHPTRLLGENFQNCTRKTELFGGYGLSFILNLNGSKNVDVECLELTDHSQCTRAGKGYASSEGCSKSYPLSDYARAGIATNIGTASVVLKNLDIHGLTSQGIIGPIGGDITADHLRLAFNGEAGWDFDDGNGTKSVPDAVVHAAYLTVEWNGCNEEYPRIHAVSAFSCFDQQSGGYGDGVGTPDTPLSFTCDHCTFRYNTQDGLDLLHASGGETSILNSTSYGNMGQQWKMGSMRSLIFRNNVTVNNCRRLSAPMAGAPEGYNRYLSLFCRAAGDGTELELGDDGDYFFQNNSFAGYGATSYSISCSGRCSRVRIFFENNLHLGYRDPVGGKRAAVFYTKGLPQSAFAARDHNIYYEMRTCPAGKDERCVNPMIANLPEWSGEASLDGIDFHLTGGSPARATGVKIPEVKSDHDGVSRPSNSAYDIGAFGFRE